MRLLFITCCLLSTLPSCMSIFDDQSLTSPQEKNKKIRIKEDIDKSIIEGTWEIVFTKVIDDKNQFLKACKQEGVNGAMVLGYFESAFNGCQLDFKGSGGMEIKYNGFIFRGVDIFPEMEYGSFEAYKMGKETHIFELYINGSDYFAGFDNSHNKYRPFTATVQNNNLELMLYEFDDLLKITFYLKKIE